MQAFVMLGARNLGGAIADALVERGWSGAAIARSEDTLTAVRERGLMALRADVQDPAELAGALTAAKERFSAVDLLVDAVSVAVVEPGVPWGGGALAETDLSLFESWTVAVARQAYVCLSEAAAQRPARVIEVGNSAMASVRPGTGLWAAGWHAVRALTTAARLELAEQGVEVGLVAVIGPIRSPKTAAMVANMPPELVNEQSDVAAAIAAYATADQLAPELEIKPG